MRAVVGALALIVLAAGCASRASVREVAARAELVRAEVAALRQAQQDAVRDDAQARADLKALEERVRDLAAAVTASSEELARVRARLTAAEEQLAAVRAELTARAEPAPAPPADRPPPPADATKPAEKPTPAPPARASGPEAMYSAALATFRAREHGQAVLEFLDFLARYPQHPLAANAQYWIGEAYYVQRDYRQALVEFQRVLEHPNVNGKWADALLKIGMCYDLLLETTQARRAWQRLVAEFPSSPAAVRAREFLRAARRAAR